MAANGVRLGPNARPLDVKPTIRIVVFSVLLSVGLIVADSLRSDMTVETAALSLSADTTDRVAARQIGGQSAGRQIVSPAVGPESVALVDDADSVDETIEAEVASATEERSDSSAELEESSAEVIAQDGDGDQTQLALADIPATTVAVEPIAAHHHDDSPYNDHHDHNNDGRAAASHRQRTIQRGSDHCRNNQ